MRNIFFFIITLSILISCSDVPDLSEYQGVNYIENSNFATINWTSDDPVQGAYHYMGFNTDSAGVAAAPGIAIFTGLPNNTDSGDISRLEIFNLVTDGDFEDGTAGWDNNGSGATFAQNNLSTNRVHDDVGNDSLRFTIPVETDILRFDLSTLNDTFIAGQNYIARLFFTRSTKNDTVVFEYNDGLTPAISNPYKVWTPKVQTGWITDDSLYTSFPDDENLNTNITAEAGARFCINSFNTTIDKFHDEGFIDDFRIIRSGLDYYIKLTVPFTAPGRPDLYSGTYRFAVYIKGEASGDISPAQDRFRSSRISLGIDNNITGFSTSSYNNTTWTQISVEKFIQINDGDTIELKLSSADSTALPNSLDIGSVLIAFPSLYYISD